MGAFDRAFIICAGLMGAAGVALAAAAAHQPDAARLAPASQMLLFHAAALLGAAALLQRGSLHGTIGGAAGLGLVAGAVLFASDLTLRQFAGHGLFPMAAPTGGMTMIGSWLVLALSAIWPGRGR